MHSNNGKSMRRCVRISSVGIAAVILTAIAGPIRASDVSGHSVEAKRAVAVCRPTKSEHGHQAIPLTPDSLTIPVRAGLSASTVTAGDTCTASVTVDSVPSGGGSIQIYCDPPEAFQSPGGSWPYVVNYADGASTTALVSLIAQSVSSTTSATIYFGDSSQDTGDLSAWQLSAPVTIVTGSAPKPAAK